MNIRSRIYLILFFSCVLFQGCGQKGPLYLPGETEESAPTTNTEPDIDEH